MPHPLRHPSTLCALRAQAISQLKAKSGREGRGWCQLRQLEEKLDPVSRSVDQVVEVFHFMEGEDSPRRVLCPRRGRTYHALCRPLLQRRPPTL